MSSVQSSVRDALSSLQTRLLVASRTTVGRAWSSGRGTPHCDHVGRLYWLRGGEARLRHHDRDFHLRPGRLFAIPAHTPFHYSCAHEMDQCYIHFQARLLGCLDPFDALGWRFEAKPKTPRHIETLWDLILSLPGNAQPRETLEADGILRQILAELAPAVSNAGCALERVQRFRPVLAYIEQHLGERIRLSQLAASVYLQPTYFSNLFAATLGVPPKRYVNQRRVERAQALLWQGRMGLAEIARELGFADQFYFSRVFKRETGISPSAYRRQKRLDN